MLLAVAYKLRVEAVGKWGENGEHSTTFYSLPLQLSDKKTTVETFSAVASFCCCHPQQGYSTWEEATTTLSKPKPLGEQRNTTKEGRNSYIYYNKGEF